MKVKTKLLFCLIALLTSIGCETLQEIIEYGPGDSGIGYNVSFENATEHTIDVTIAVGVYATPENFQLGPGEHFVDLGTNCDVEDGAILREQLQWLIPQTITITYDNQYSVFFARDTDNDYLCNLEDYTIMTIHELLRVCHYIFTEADYEYAKADGEIVIDSK